MEKVLHLPVAKARSFMNEMFTALGVPPEDVQIVTDVLIASDLRGIQSHGIGRLRYYFDRIRRGQHQSVTKFEIVREGPATALIDGNHGMGHVIGVRAMRLAIEKARLCGTGIVAVRNSTHYGIAGYYALMAVEAGMVGMTCTNARPAVSPTHSVFPMLGTNPIAFGAPTDEPGRPFLFDAATSIVQRGKYEVLARDETPGLPGWTINRDGSFALESVEVLKKLEAGEVALLPLGGAGESHGGHKGYGLSVMVEILSSALQSGAFLYGLIGFDRHGSRQPYRVGHFFMAIDIEHFIPLDEFKRTSGEIQRQLRAAARMPGCDRVYTAGEKEVESESRVQEQGIPVGPSLLADLEFIRSELGLNDLLCF